MMRKISIIAIVVFSKVICSDYDEEEEEELPPTNLRIIGGDPVKNHTADAPFIITYKIMRNIPEFCSGVLLTPTIALTASRCFHYFTTDEAYQACVEATDSGKYYKYKHTNGKITRVKCKFEEKDGEEIRYVITPATRSRGKAWILSTDRKMEKDKVESIKKIIIHPSFVPGKEYGDWGGADIALIQFTGNGPSGLDVNPTGGNFACLPTKEFDADAGSGDQLNDILVIAGYGNYTRNTALTLDNRFTNTGSVCQTNEFGRQKHHYCYTPKNMKEDESPCIVGDMDDSEIPEQNAKCKMFFKTQNLGPEENEALIIGENDEVVNCFPEYNPENKRYGKCLTQGDYYNFKDPKTYTDDDRDWGYCSKECYLKESEKDEEKLRTKMKLDILSDKDCDRFYNTSNPELDVKPEVYCVGEIKPGSIYRFP